VNTGPEANERIYWIFKRLRKLFGEKKPRRERDLLGLLVRTVLSQNTNDLNRDRAYAELRAKFPSWEGLRKGRQSEIERAIRKGGLARQKSKWLKEILERLKRERHSLDLSFLGQMPTDAAREYLLGFKGIGEKTAAILLLFGCGRNAFPVDTHVFRVTQRLGLLPAKAKVAKAHSILGAMVPAELAYEFHVNLIEHGRKICHARKPECPVCPLKDRCKYCREETIKP
jgi:endonuclease-3